MAQADRVHDTIKIIFLGILFKKGLRNIYRYTEKTEKDHKEDFQESVHYKRHNP